MSGDYCNGYEMINLDAFSKKWYATTEDMDGQFKTQCREIVRLVDATKNNYVKDINYRLCMVKRIYFWLQENMSTTNGYRIELRILLSVLADRCLNLGCISIVDSLAQDICFHEINDNMKEIEINLDVITLLILKNNLADIIGPIYATAGILMDQMASFQSIALKIHNIFETIQQIENQKHKLFLNMTDSFLK